MIFSLALPPALLKFPIVPFYMTLLPDITVLLTEIHSYTASLAFGLCFKFLSGHKLSRSAEKFQNFPGDVCSYEIWTMACRTSLWTINYLCGRVDYLLVIRTTRAQGLGAWGIQGNNILWGRGSLTSISPIEGGVIEMRLLHFDTS